MADLQGSPADFVQVKPANLPAGVSMVEIETQEFNGTVIVPSLQAADGKFAIADMFPSKPAGTYRFKGRYQAGGLWGVFAGVATTIEVQAPAPPETADWEVTST